MTRERWEVRATHPVDGVIVSYSIHPATVNGPAHARDGAQRAARDYRERGLDPVVVHIRTYRVEVVYAWRHALGFASIGTRWLSFDLQTWTGMNAHRAEFRDPLGKHSRKRAKAAAVAAKPCGPCVLVAIRRRVKEA